MAGSASTVAAATVFTPDPAVVEASQVTAFMRFCEEATGHEFRDYAAFDEFAARDYRSFWRAFLDWSGLPWEGPPEPVCTDDACERAAFFPGVRLSYAESLLAAGTAEADEAPALVAHHALRPPDRLSRRELRERVLGVAQGLTELGVGPGDRVVAVGGNGAEMAIAGLAVTAVGAAFASGAPDMGARAIVSRFEQLAPTLLMAALVAGGEGTSTAPAARAAEVAAGLPSITALVALDDGPAPPGLDVPLARMTQMLAPAEPAAWAWERFPFNHPLFVLFTSGTTGLPKCIVHGAGGTLLEHVKEHRLHVDLRAGDTVLFHTSAAWMMWNWQLSALASGARIVLYDGPIAGPETLWDLVGRERVTVFGTSPPYLQLCEDSRYSPRREQDLGALRGVLSTGSILHDWQYDWVAEHVGPPPQSISGGTDIIGCFVLGNPNLPVYRGRLQCRSLGLDVEALAGEEAGGSVVGELVCRNPFPSRPLGLLGDDDGARFHDAYFAQNPGVWTHGDLIELTPDGQARMHGRSDGVMNVGGVRIGPAEIYRALGEVAELREALAVEQDIPGERGRSRVVLLVVLREGALLDAELDVRIRREIARGASPSHVPELVVQVDELPATHSGKRSERAARDALAGLAPGNADALANPDSLDAIVRAVEDAARRGLRVTEPPRSGVGTEERLRAIWRQVLGVAALRPDDNFFDVGGTSLVAVRLLDAIHERMGVELPLSALLDAPTTAAMAAMIDGPESAHAPAIVLLRPGTDDTPLFLVHSLFGDVLSMRLLATRLDTRRVVYGVQARGLQSGAPVQDRVEDMAAAYVESVRATQAHGPYLLGGHSLGGLIAFELARRLTARGERVAWLGLIDSQFHPSCLPAPVRARFYARAAVRDAGAAVAGSRRRDANRWRELVTALASRGPATAREREPALPPRLRALERAGWAAYRAYRPAPYSGSATLFRVTERRDGVGDRQLPVWQRIVHGGLTVEPVAGDHESVIAEPHVRLLARRFSAQLARAS